LAVKECGAVGGTGLDRSPVTEEQTLLFAVSAASTKKIVYAVRVSFLALRSRA